MDFGMQGGIRPFSNIQLDPQGMMLAEQMARTGPQDYISQVPQQGQLPDQTMGVGREIMGIDPNKVGMQQELPPPGGGGGGIGLSGTLGILNLGAGIGGTIAKAFMSKSPPAPRQHVQGPSGNYFR